MNNIIILITVIILSALIGKSRSPYARIIIASIFGIAYFSIWRYYVFYADLYEITITHQHIVYFSLLIGAIVVSLILIRIKYYYTVAAVSVLVFVISTVTSYFASTTLKNEVAIISGFYVPGGARTFTKAMDERKFVQTTGLYSVDVPVSWDLHKDKGPLFPYFTWQDNGQKLLEFRPRCFNKSKLSIPQIIINYRDSEDKGRHDVNSICREYKKESAYSCRVKIRHNNKQITRLEYFATYRGQSKGVELDFVLNKANANVLMHVNRVIQSAEPLIGKSNNSRCLGLAEWM